MEQFRHPCEELPGIHSAYDEVSEANVRILSRGSDIFDSERQVEGGKSAEAASIQSCVVDEVPDVKLTQERPVVESVKENGSDTRAQVRPDQVLQELICREGI